MHQMNSMDFSRSISIPTFPSITLSLLPDAHTSAEEHAAPRQLRLQLLSTASPHWFWHGMPLAYQSQNDVREHIKP